MTSEKNNVFSSNPNIEAFIQEFYGKDTELKSAKEKYHRIVQAGIAKWIADFQKGIIVIRSVDDLKTLIELDLHLQKHK